MKRLILLGMLVAPALAAAPTATHYHEVSLTDCSLFERNTAALALHEGDLLCGKEPAWEDREAWYTFGDCSGYYGPVDSAEVANAKP